MTWSLPAGYRLQQVDNTMPFDCSWGTSEANTDSSMAVYRMALVLSLIARWKAALEPCGVPSLGMIVVVQPSRLPACWTIWPSCWHSGFGPHGMKDIVFPFGTGLPMGWVIVIFVGRCV